MKVLVATDAWHPQVNGVVLLEALASGVPVAAFPVTGPRDVIGNAPVGALSESLREACLAALQLSRDDCRTFALGRSWEASAQAFIKNIVTAARGRTNVDGSEPVAASPRASAEALSLPWRGQPR